MKLSTYILTTGELCQAMELPDLESIAANYDPITQGIVQGWFESDEYYVQEGEVVKKPEKPDVWAVFDYETKTWIDSRSPETIAADLVARRNMTSLDKSDLLIRLAVAGILTPTEAEDAASGIIPASMVPMLESLPADAQMAARIKWKSDTQISRTHPVIVAAAYAMGVTDEQLDTIFGVST